MGIFGNLFDLNHDGRMDAMEQAAEMSFLQMMIMEEEQQKDDEEEDSGDSGP